jgi:hypothetical protein
MFKFFKRFGDFIFGNIPFGSPGEKDWGVGKTLD